MNRKTKEPSMKFIVDFPSQDEVLNGIGKVLDEVLELKERFADWEHRFYNPTALEALPEILSKHKITKALGIGNKKFQRLLLAGLNDLSGGEDAQPRYSKAQLIELLRKKCVLNQ